MADRPNFAALLEQRNMATPEGNFAGAVSATDTAGGRPNFALLLEQRQAPEGIMADTPPQFLDPSTLRLGQQFSAGVHAGTNQVQQSGFALIRMLGRSMGSSDIETFGQRGIERNQKEIEAFHPSTQSIGDIEDFDTFLEWVAGGLGQALPSLATAMAGGGIGGVIGKQIVKRRIANEMTDRMLGSMAAQGFARDAATGAAARTLRNPATARILRDAIRHGDAVDMRRGLLRGSALGTFIPSSGMMTGEAELAGVRDPALALGVGVAGGLLETAVLTKFVSRLFPGVDAKVSKNFVRDFAKATGSQAALEGSQEGAQQMIQLAALAWHDPSFDLLDPENAMQVVDAFAIGALVGTAMGAGGSAIGELGVRARGIRGSADTGGGTIDPFEPPDLGPPGGRDNGLPPDFEPADNTMAEEITKRMNDVMRGTIVPAMNTIQSRVKDTLDRIADKLPGARQNFEEIVAPVRQINDEFVAGSEPIIEDVRRYAGEQVAYIVETAETITDPEARAKFIEEEFAQVQEEIGGVADELTKRAEELSQTASNQVQQMEVGDIFDNELFITAGADPEFTFGQNETLKTSQGVSFQRPTRGERAVPIKTRKSAENRLRELRKAYPSATEDSFEIVDTEGGYLIRLADQLQRADLQEDEVVTRGIQNARTSARGSSDTTRQVRLENEKMIVDVPTLAFQGRKLDRGDQQSLAEGFAAMTGRMLDRGLISDQDFKNLSRVFESHFSKDEQLANIRMIAERQAAIDRGNFKPKRRKRGRGVRGQRSTETQRDFDTLPPEVQARINERVDDQLDEEAEQTGGMNIGYNAAQAVLEAEAMPLANLIEEHQNGTIISSVTDDARGFSFRVKKTKRKNPGRSIRREELLQEEMDALTDADFQEDQTTDPNDFAYDEALESAQDEEAQAQASRDKRNPNKRDIPQQPKTPSRIAQLRRQNREIGDSIARKEDQLQNLLDAIDYWEGLDAESELRTTNRDAVTDLRAQVAEVEAAIADDIKAMEQNSAQIEKIQNQKPRKKKDKKPATPRQVIEARQRARLEREEKRDKELKKKRRKRKKPTLRTPDPEVSSRRPAKSPEKRAKVWLPGATNQKQTESAVKEIVAKVLSLIPERQTELRVINREAIRQMQERNHPDGDIVGKLKDVQIAAILSVPGRPTYILVPEMEKLNATLRGQASPEEIQGLYGAAMIHELGHYIHYETWESLSREGQDKLLEAFRKDVKSGKFVATEPLARMLGALTQGGDVPMSDNLFEFREWMADQMVDWMMNRRQPRNAVEKFMEKVAMRLQNLWDWFTFDSGRHGNLNETYADFVDTLAKRVKQPGYGNDFWFKEGSVSRSKRILFERHPQAPVEFPQLSPNQLARLRRSLEAYPRIATNANKMIEWMKNAYYVALAPSTSRMRDLSKKGISAADELVRMFSRQPHGQSKVGRVNNQNYHQAREQMQGIFGTRMAAILKGASEAELFRLGQELRAMDGNENMVPTTLRGRAIRKLLDEMHAYAKEAGLPVGKIPNYWPRTFNREKLIADQEAVIDYLINVYEAQLPPHERATSRAATENKARRVFNSLISQDADAAAALRELTIDPLATQVPAGGFMRSRTATDKFFGEYYNDNVESILINYINTVTKRAEYNRRLGQKAFPQQVGGDNIPRSRWNPKKRLQEILQSAREQGATDDELQYMKKYVEANLGMYGRDDIPDGARKILASVVAYQNMRTLLFSVFASLPDAMGPAIRSGDMRGAFKTLFKNISDIRQTDGATADMARTWGIISDAYNHHVLSEFVDNHFMPKGIRKWNDAFFKYTGLNWWTDFTRKAALSVGLDSIKNESMKAQFGETQKIRDRAKQFLGELGLTSSDVNKWVSRGQPTWGSLTYNETNEDNIAADRAVANAMVQFVDEAILRPNPAQRPILASHPAMILFYHLKGFMYAIHDTILKRLAHNFRIADTPAQIAQVFIPAVGMMLLTAVGLELRELVAGTRRTDSMDGWEYTWEVFERTGLPGLTQYAWDWDSASARGQSELAGLGGPAMSQVGDLLSKPTSQTIPKGIPVVSQLPWAREFLREATPL